jgi:glucose-6-phosphate dehydrogenase assembly protein OpcA
VEKTVMSAALSPERMLRELADLWVSLGKEGREQTGAGVLRACTMTLLTVAEEGEDLAELSETIAALMPEHPARTILVRLSGAGDRALSHRVYAQCWMPFGQRRQICCEQIEIVASDPAVGDLPPVLMALAAPDLPLILWCRSGRLAAMPEFAAMAGIAQKVIVNTSGTADPAGALARLEAGLAKGSLLADLAWTRLTRWREMLAQVFENREYLARLASVSSAVVTFSGDEQTTGWYLAAWMGAALAEVGAQCAPAVERRAAGALRVELSGDGLRVVLERRGDRLEVSVNEGGFYTNLPQPSDYLLMSEELGIVRRDPVFEEALASAVRQAYADSK